MEKLMVTAPLCFHSPEQMNRWYAAAARASDADTLKRGDYCVDCTPEYQQEMLQQGRCAHPETTFTEDDDGFVIGSRS
jgi:hypothetical protein